MEDEQLKTSAKWKVRKRWSEEENEMEGQEQKRVKRVLVWAKVRFSDPLRIESTTGQLVRAHKAYMIKQRQDRTEDKQGTMDSGANIAITTREIAESLGLTIHERRTPVDIGYGKAGLKSVATHYVNMGEIIGNVNIVDGAMGTMIKLDGFTSRGWSVVFRAGLAEIVHPSGAVLVSCEQDEDSKLWQLDICQIMALPSVESMILEHREREKVMPQRYSGKVVQSTRAIRKQEGDTGVHEFEMKQVLNEYGTDEDNEEWGDNQDWECQKSTAVQGPKVKRRTARLMTREMVKYVTDLHRNNGHLSEGKLKLAVENNSWKGLPAWLKGGHVSDVYAKMKKREGGGSRAERTKKSNRNHAPDTVQPALS